MNKYTNTQNPQYQELLPIAREVREAVKPFVGSYIQVYTEPRVKGLRTKFWGLLSGAKMKRTKAGVEAFNQKYPEYEFKCFDDGVAVSIYINRRK